MEEKKRTQGRPAARGNMTSYYLKDSEEVEKRLLLFWVDPGKDTHTHSQTIKTNVTIPIQSEYQRM